MKVLGLFFFVDALPLHRSQFAIFLCVFYVMTKPFLFVMIGFYMKIMFSWFLVVS